MSNIYIHNARIFLNDDADTFFNHGAIVVRNGVVAAVGDHDQILASHPIKDFDGEVIDAEGRLLLPGFINLHGHFYGAYSRGLDLRDAPAKNFLQVLERLWWRLDRALDAKGNEMSAKFVMAQAIRSGTTTIVDHHASPSALAGSLDTIADAVRGLCRISVCYEVTDRNGEAERDAGIAENIRFAERVAAERAAGKHDIHAMMGLHASFTCCEETLAKCKTAIAGSKVPELGYHVHVAEGTTDVDDSLAKYGCGVVEHLHRAGLTGPNSIFAHCVNVTEKEKEILGETGTIVVHNPSSNLNNAVGVQDLVGLSDRYHATVCLGTDGMSQDMMGEHKFAYVIHKLINGSPVAGSMEAYNALFKNNGKVASKFFDLSLGRLDVGAAGDIALLDYYPPTDLNKFNIPWHLMFGMSSQLVDTTVLAGKVLMRGHKIIAFNEREVMEAAREHAPVVHQAFWDIVEKEKNQNA